MPGGFRRLRDVTPDGRAFDTLGRTQPMQRDGDRETI